MASKEQNLAVVAKELAKTEVEIEKIKKDMLVGMRCSDHAITAAVS
jgi:hypothetical protein